ncbi:PadR family transcriptional regulator [Kineococcus sp. R8]|uniref:helix-turn-helix transcriptional regulator n=1 Tax=Kineococcus siccus TaxID=2696567 RepID=UPI001412F69C|nr:PadR family transcriptional regulator [Kineococcus siccus]
MVRRRADSLQLAVLALLADGPLHGYEVRRRLDLRLGAFRALSYGTLYPCLRQLQTAGWVEETTQARAAGTVAPRRTRVTYALTGPGRARLAQLLEEAGPDAWEDDAFGVRLALFARVAPRTRLRVLEGRRARLLERLEQLTHSIERAQAVVDAYALEAQRHGLDTVRREVDWLDGLIEAEERRPPAGPVAGGEHDPGQQVPGHHGERERP